MENENLIVSALQPGPLGPYRRVYELGPKAESRMRYNLRNSIETLLHFYDNYRKTNPQKLYDFPKELGERITKGNILFAAFPVMTSFDVETIREILTKSDDSSLSILGPDQMMRKTGIKFETVGEDPTSIIADSHTFSEILIHGVPQPEILEDVIAECKRTLIRGGQLSIRVPLVFFEESTKPSFGDFIQITAANLFPGLGVVEGRRLKQFLEQFFPKNGVYETSLGEVVFWAIKS
jgi:hypothetical protein